MRSPRCASSWTPLPHIALLVCLIPLGCPTADDAADGDADGDADTAGDNDTTAGGNTTGGDDGDSGSTGGSDADDTADDTAGDTAGDSGDSGSSSESEGSGTTGAVVCGPVAELGVFTPADGDARGFAVDGDTVFLAVTSAGLEAVDITDPAAPTSLGTVDFGNGELAFTVAVAGEYAYVGQRSNGWKIVDITDPSAMVEVASDDTDGAEGVQVVGDTFYVIDPNGIRTYDVTDPTMPTELSPIVILPGSSNELAVDGDYAYVAASGGGLIVVDVSNPAMPTEVSAFDTVANAQHVATDGTTVYTSHQDGVNILDLSDATTPVELGMYARDRASALAIDGSRLYVTGDDTSTTEVPFLAVIDVTDPAALVELDISYDDLDDPFAIAVDDGRLIFTNEDDDALHIVDPCPAM